jgi:hypothetical protein
LKIEIDHISAKDLGYVVFENICKPTTIAKPTAKLRYSDLRRP